MSSDNPAYDPTDDLVTILSQPDSLEQLDKLILATRSHKLQLVEEIKESLNKSKTDAPTEQNELNELILHVSDTQSLSRKTETTISNLIKDISYLDNAKKNLTQSMTWFKNLNSLADAYATCKSCYDSDMFQEMSSPYSIMISMTTLFQEYKSVDEINTLLYKVYTLERDTVNKLKHLFRQLIEQKNLLKLDEVAFREGVCKLLEVNPAVQEEVIEWVLTRILSELREIFNVEDEAGSLENISRRYLFFKKVLNNFQVNIGEYFDPALDMPLRLTAKFVSFTSKDLGKLLDREMQGNRPLELFVSSLQTTIDFEKYISVKFSNKLNTITNDKISRAFEPHLSLWVSHHDQVMKSKMLTYLSEPKLPNSTDSNVVPSSADLFRTYRNILTRTLELIDTDDRTNVLSDLAEFFSRWLIEYLEKILRPFLVPDNAKIEDIGEVLQVTILMVNTADYCSITAGQLEEKLYEYAKSSERISMAIDHARSKYSKLISRGIQFLLHHVLAAQFRFAWREFANSDWNQLMAEDYGRYVLTLRHILIPEEHEKSLLQDVFRQFNRDVYAWNLLNNVIDMIITDYLRCIVSLLRAKEPFCTQNSERTFAPKKVIQIAKQLLLDINMLQDTLKQLPTMLPNDRAEQGKRVSKQVDNSIDKLKSLAKLLAAPAESPESYYEYYSQTTENRNSIVWALIFILKGMPWDLTVWSAYWTQFSQKGAPPNDNNTDLFVFQKDESIITSFVKGFSSVTDQSWQAFLSNDLGIISLQDIKTSSSTDSPGPMTSVNRTINENLKQLVSTTRFFHRGG